MSERLRKITLFLFCASIVTIGVSVSLSQGFLVLAFLSTLFRPKTSGFWKEPTILVALLFFGWYFSNFLIHASYENNFLSYAKTAWNAELKDVFLFSGVVVAWNLRKEEFPAVFKALRILFWILLITGIVSSFSSVRLSRLISDLYRDSPNWKFTHPMGQIVGIPLFLPIGLMNTHLTFGGLLQFFFPLPAFLFLKSLFENDKKASFRNGIILLLFLYVVFLNNARSAMIGAMFSCVTAFFVLGPIRKELPTAKILFLASAGLFVLLILGIGLSFTEAGQKITDPLFGKQKHTDSGRTFIWDSTFPLIRENPITGIGPGNYNREIEKTRKDHSERYPELYYFYETTQRGHAHNDSFHLLAVFGLPAFLLFLTLGTFLYRKLVYLNLPYGESLYFFGLSGFFVSGLFQCYFQDDEVVILFWILCGFLLRTTHETTSPANNDRNFTRNDQSQ
ncbi:O-antigen ligase domain-containing protein [Leptospira gomenensis]|uniref:O-antigen ligase domain-containing protein n=1 Tax=Leptospira gomenensis TaxID=2484974 RepID=A0A5F1YD72_9LEPT|nr:O-antigen ligase family protein [Leptospira gomenensis]TGK35196.1 O-antigen ligase domain-containing protein [Leptospira gomenensis]TGK37405.1 O-antigen ligase domain-containing protein [Leptospira gomenensis]TGK41057.1 O-antigen ligase domain-containing protein [Leptospira gomenensis]TGK61287.1 O-antigen ligase domain-containing protein [Leptospira gomenensis]